MSDGNVIELQDGRVELAGSPGHVNVIATDDLSKAEVELRLDPEQKDRLAWAVRENQPYDAETGDGQIGWEPGRGLYVEVYGEDDFYLLCSPDDQERLAEGLSNARPA